MKKLWVGRKGTIIKDILKGYKGQVVGFDSTIDEAMVKIGEETLVLVPSEFIIQEGDFEQLELDI